MVRAAVPSDITTIATLHTAARATYYEGRIPVAEYASAEVLAHVRAGWVRSIARDDGGVLCAEHEGDVAGVAAFRVIEGDVTGDMTLTQFHVDPARWSRGIGSALHTAVVEAWRRSGVRRARLEVYEHNLRAQRFYAAHGWQPARDVVRAPDSAHLPMWREVPPAGESPGRPD
ncbi:GNAT family N-acetyltransferase [Streptomyces sp. NPDC051320]|uniref:GNAT family N-acetyltransferase n=1 Tax=Streptomyces sp. NPDC051320 TaxID=3154644 RepID=UPI003448B67D